MSHTATIDKVEQLGKYYVEKILKWKAEQKRPKNSDDPGNYIGMCRRMLSSPVWWLTDGVG